MNVEYLRRRIAVYQQYIGRGLDAGVEQFYEELVASAQEALNTIEEADQRRHEEKVS